MSTVANKYRKWFFIGFIAISIMLTIGLVRNLKDLLQTQDRFVSAEKNLQQLESKKAQLLEKIDGQDRDLATEKAIRDQLGLAKPGEKVVILPEDLDQFTIPEAEVIPTEKLPNWRKWYNLFF